MNHKTIVFLDRIIVSSHRTYSAGGIATLLEVAKLQITDEGVQVITTTGQMVCPEKPYFSKVASRLEEKSATDSF